MTDLTRGRLDELERRAQVCNCKYCQELELPLIAMAKRTKQAERERDMLRKVVETIVRFYDDSGAEPEYERAQSMYELARDALAQSTTDAGGAE